MNPYACSPKGCAMQSIAGKTDCLEVNCLKGKRSHPGVRTFGARNDNGKSSPGAPISKSKFLVVTTYYSYWT